MPEDVDNPDPQVPNGPMPLGVRVIGGAIMLLSGYSIIDQALSWWIEGHPSWSWWFLLLPMGWGLLRRREWARITTSMTSVFVATITIVTLPFWMSIRGGITHIYPPQSDSYAVITSWLATVCLAGFWTFRVLEFEPARTWFRSSKTKRPFRRP